MQAYNETIGGFYRRFFNLYAFGEYTMNNVAKILLSAVIVGLSGCGPTKWDELRKAELLNESNIKVFCNSINKNALRCTQAQNQENALTATRARYVKEDEAKCERAWKNYERELDGYDRELAAYDRKLDRHERDKDRKARECEREEDRHDRALDRYERCLDRQANSSSTYSYSYCSPLSIPFCLRGSFNLPPSKPRKPWTPFCSRP